MQTAVVRPFLLIVDDDQRILRALRLVLRNDYEVLLASCLSDARTQLASARVEAVLCDQRMPDGLGSDFLALLAKEHPLVVRLLHTGSPPENAQLLIDSGIIHGMVVKPASVAELRTNIDNLIKR